MAKSGKSGKGKKSKGSASVSFKGVDSGGRSISDGWAVGKIAEAELTTAKESGNEMFKIVIQAQRGKQKAKVWDNLVLTPNALWKMRSLLEAAGVEVDEEEDMEFTAEDLLDLDEFDVELVNEEYEGKMRPRVVSFATLGTHTEEDGEDEEEEEDEDEKPSKSKKKSKKSRDEDEDDEDDEDEDDEDSDDEDEDEDDDPPPRKKGKSKSKSDDEEDEDEDEEDDDDDSDDDESEDDDDEDEDEEEDEKPKKGKKSKAKLKAGQKVKFKDDKGKTKSGVITSIDDDTVFVEDKDDEEWELSTDEIIV